MKIYIVNIITYADSHRHRDIYRERPTIFKTEEEAEEYVLNAVRDHVKEEIDELPDDFMDLDTDILIERYLTGEYVDYTLTYAIEEIDMSDIIIEE